MDTPRPSPGTNRTRRVPRQLLSDAQAWAFAPPGCAARDVHCLLEPWSSCSLAALRRAPANASAPAPAPAEPRPFGAMPFAAAEPEAALGAPALLGPGGFWARGRLWLRVQAVRALFRVRAPLVAALGLDALLAELRLAHDTGGPPPLPTVAPTHVPTVHALC